jgi:hypothetical protein
MKTKEKRVRDWKERETYMKVGVKRSFVKMEALFSSELQLEFLRITFRVLLVDLLLDLLFDPED